MDVMRTNERRRHRADNAFKALEYQLQACCEDGRIDAMVVANADGLPLASSGQPEVCDEVAARMTLGSSLLPEFSGTLLGSGQHWQVSAEKIDMDGSEVLLCVIGGTEDARHRQLARGVRGAIRIFTRDM